jgi:multidrug efflux pump subunit AcrB
LCGRDRAANFCVKSSNVCSTHSVLLAGNTISIWEDVKYIENYDVVVQIPEKERNKDALDLLQVLSNNASIDSQTPTMVSLARLFKVKDDFVSCEVDEMDLQHKVTITGILITMMNKKYLMRFKKF